MKHILRTLLYFFVVTTLVHCSTLSKIWFKEGEPPPEEKYDIDYPPELEKVQEMLLTDKTDDAIIKIEDYLNRAENIHWYGHAYFLKAYTYELQEKFNLAAKQYRFAIQHANRYDSRLEAMAMYNLSFVLERMERIPEMIVLLVDLMKRRDFFEPLTREAEIPARLAAAYAARGKMKETKIFHQEAVQGFESLASQNLLKTDKQEVSKVLYYLGVATFDASRENYTRLVTKLKWGQKYFLASAEASKSIWSDRATDRLIKLYDRAWSVVKAVRPVGFENDPMAKKKLIHLRQLEMASELYDMVHQLRVEEFPLSNVNPRSKRIMDATGVWLRQIERFALTLNLGPEMVRNKKIKNKPLTRYVEKQEEKVLVNKEQKKMEQKLPKKDQQQDPKKELPPKDDIGDDPNL